MPIYEYVCDACGFEKDVIQKMSDAPLKDCPTCSEPSFRKRISAAGFRLAGSGWYETDFKTGSKKNLADNSKSSPSESAAG
ncbi:FmdB family zinc ribbon protein [Marinobacter zhejiangensis]|uniref:Putative regulatory protein, FmdB family n=1 Tax=Marinobacter zhejiangensis TaxID=488535 RepID=A0A1I4RK81_9GAMM|nr:FmdB family zinc ribbon protein [Marinobacter zhejiangensis]SFM52619.1 putative regulatory protein, FmdB family [Marinobacter zhejiangensis]